MKAIHNFTLQNFHYFVIILSVIWFFSCQELIEIDSPKTELIRRTVFESDLTATAAISALYVDLSVSSGTFSSITTLGGFSSDELIPYTNEVEYRQLYENDILTTNTLIANLWSEGYSTIYKANAILEGLENSNKLTPAVQSELEGEAKFLRAFSHFYLLNLFGDVPLIKTTDYRINNAVSRASKLTVYDAILADLVEAINLLPDGYIDAERIRPNKWAATALLARAYLYAGDWLSAEEASTSVINNISLYNLVGLDEVFLKNSNEAIWQLLPVLPDQNTNDGKTFILTGPPTFAALRNDFMDAFEIGDLRKDSWVGLFTDGGSTWYYPYKYKIQTGSDPLNEYSMVLRLAEQYLIRAEARAQQNNVMGAKADLNTIRQRSGLNDTQANDQAALLTALEQERKVELFTEWGHRWLDLNRTTRTDAILNPIKQGWKPTDELYPIPQSEILINRNLEPQNPGY